MRDSFSSFPIRELVSFKRLSRSDSVAPDEVEIRLRRSELSERSCFQLLVHRIGQFLAAGLASFLYTLQKLAFAQYL